MAFWSGAPPPATATGETPTAPSPCSPAGSGPGPSSAVRVPDRLAGAVTTAVLNRLDKGLARDDLGLSETPGGAPVLATRGPRPGQRPGAYETVPYAQALHTLGLTALLDEVPPF